MADDLAEEHRRFVRPVRGGARAALWYWWQVLRSAAALIAARFGEDTTTAKGGGMRMGSVMQDIRYALRGLRSRPVFTVTVVVTLALGVGGTAAIFTVLRGTLLRPLPYVAPDDTYVFWDVYSWQPKEFALLRDDWDAFDAVGAYWPEQEVLQVDGGAATAEDGLLVTHEIFQALGRDAALGRVLTADDEGPGGGSPAPVAVIAWGLWQELGGQRDILNRTVRISGVDTRVVGVMPPDFFFPDPGVRIWRPMNIDPRRGGGYLALLGRSASGVGPGEIQANVDRVTARLGETFQYPAEFDRTRDPSLTPVKSYLFGDTRTPLLLVAGALALTLLVACANVAALLVARTDARRGELAVRTAVGAGRGRLARQLCTETLVLGGLAGLAAAVVGSGALRLLRGLLPVPPGMAEALGVDVETVLAAVVVGVTTGAVVGMGPVLRLLRGHGSLSQGGARGRIGGSRLESGLVVAEVALALLLVGGAGLLVRSVRALERVDTGVDPSGVLVVDLVAGNGDFGGQELPGLYRELRQRVGELPGVTSVGLTQKLPLRGRGWITGVGDLDQPGGDEVFAFVRFVTPGYLEALGVPLLQGRGMDEVLDAPGADRSALVNETLAHTLWPDGNPLGHRTSDAMGNDVTVVGVVGDVKEGDLTDPREPVLYVPLMQNASFVAPTMVLASRPGADTELAASVREVVAAVDSRVAVDRIESMDAVVEQAQGEALRVMRLLAALGGLALLLGAVGVYGVLSHWVGRRSRVWAVSLALGSSPARVVRGVVTRGLGLVIAGLILGALAFLGTARAAAGLLYEVAPWDPVALGAAAGALLGAGILAAWLPARRAARVDPMTTLRGE